MIYFLMKWKSMVVNNMKLVILLKKDFRVNIILFIGVMNIIMDLVLEYMVMLVIYVIVILD